MSEAPPEATPPVADPAAGPTDAIAITINGDPQTVPVGLTIAELLVRLDRDPRVLAVERNLELVRRKQHGETVLADGDSLEIVTLVGGG